MKFNPRYRLSTVLLVVVIIAISLSWYLDHFYKYRKEVVGTWIYSHPGYRTVLKIRPDKTFTKVQYGREVIKTFEGVYHIIGNSGKISFNVTKIQTEFGTTINVKEIEDSLYCRCAVDADGFLLINYVGAQSIPIKLGLRWETYSPKPN